MKTEIRFLGWKPRTNAGYAIAILADLALFAGKVTVLAAGFYTLLSWMMPR